MVRPCWLRSVCLTYLKVALSGDSHRWQHGLHPRLETPERQSLQRARARGNSQPAAHHFLACTADALGPAAGGVASGVRWPTSRWSQTVASTRRGRLDGGQGGALGGDPMGRGLSAAAQTQPAGAAPAPCLGRRRAARDLQRKLGPLLQPVATAYPHAHVELWATDEHRIGLKPLLRRIWAPMGQRPTATV